MNEILQYLTVSPEITAKAIVYLVASFLGMLAAYSVRWSISNSDLNWWQYLTGDSKSMVFALSTWIGTCYYLASYSYLEALDMNQVFNGAVLLGIGMPAKVDEAKVRHKAQENKLTKKQADSKPI